MGEFINMFSNYQVFNNDPSVTLARNKVLADKVMAYCNQEIINRLNEAGFNTGQKTIKQGELNDIIEEVLNDWIDDVTITTQSVLNLLILSLKRKTSINNVISIGGLVKRFILIEKFIKVMFIFK